MTPRENLSLALKNRENEWIPWLPLQGGMANCPAVIPDDMKKRADVAEIALYEQEILGCDILLSTGVVHRKHSNCIQTDTKIEGSDHITTISAGKKSIRRVTRHSVLMGMQTSAISEHFIKDKHDLEVMLRIVRDQKSQIRPEKYLEMTEKIGDRGLVIPGMPRTPLMLLIIDLAGLENFTYLMQDEEELMKELMHELSKQALEEHKLLHSSGIPFEAIRISEDHDTLLLSPSNFNQWLKPEWKNYADLCHENTRTLMIHACGHVNAFLKGELEVDIDAHHYLTEAPVGDTDVNDAFKAWGDRITVMAALDPVLLEKGTTDQVAENTSQIISKGLGRNFILMNSMKPTVPAQNLFAVRDQVKSLQPKKIRQTVAM